MDADKLSKWVIHVAFTADKNEDELEKGCRELGGRLYEYQQDYHIAEFDTTTIGSELPSAKQQEDGVVGKFGAILRRTAIYLLDTKRCRCCRHYKHRFSVRHNQA